MTGIRFASIVRMRRGDSSLEGDAVRLPSMDDGACMELVARSPGWPARSSKKTVDRDLIEARFGSPLASRSCLLGEQLRFTVRAVLSCAVVDELMASHLLGASHLVCYRLM